MKDIKTFNIRIPKEDWQFIKHKAIERDLSMNELIISLIQIHRKKCEKKVANQL